MEFTFAIFAMFTLYSKFALHYLTYLTTFVFLLIFFTLTAISYENTKLQLVVLKNSGMVCDIYLSLCALKFVIS